MTPVRTTARGLLLTVIAFLLGAGVRAPAQQPTPAAKQPAPSGQQPTTTAATTTATTTDTAAKKLPPEALQALVAPIALYPDQLLAQTLAASTYPLEIVQLHQFMLKYPKLKDEALVARALELSGDGAARPRVGPTREELLALIAAG